MLSQLNYGLLQSQLWLRSNHISFIQNSTQRFCALTFLTKSFIRSIKTMFFSIAGIGDINAAAIITEELVAWTSANTTYQWSCYKKTESLNQELDKAVEERLVTCYTTLSSLSFVKQFSCNYFSYNGKANLLKKRKKAYLKRWRCEIQANKNVHTL